MPGTFFTSWDLWQEMTFVLAMSIVAVFCAGLVKLWWNNRLMKKKEVLDEEKRARVEEMRKTGLPIKRANPVPFGVRAIQSGVEVDGIWISRPASLNELGEKLASSTTLAGWDSESSHKRGREYSEDEKSVLRATTTNLGPKQSPSTASIFQKLTDTDSLESAPSAAAAAPRVSQFAHLKTNKRQPPSQPAAAGALNEDTLRRLEGQPPSPSAATQQQQQQQKQQHYETYIPTSTTTTSPRHHHHHHRPKNPPRRPSDHDRHRSSAASSSADSVDSQPRSAKSASARSYASSSHSSRLYMAAAAPRNPQGASSPAAMRRWSEKEGRDHRDPFETPPPARTPSRLSVFFSSQGETSGSGSGSGSGSDLQQGHQGMAAPEPTFGPGGLHFNRAAARRVNEGFEVLPVGTFGVPAGETERDGEGEMGHGGRGSRTGNRLRKSGNGLEEGGR
ncbi:hypothetical protein C8A01DRAFT_33840 [Parachaetomium inaequale]|uniref:Uncharacterized protein n=1 Tax=Parachaetomium inaequale TaxID=2588326 RepID=A0AAN6PJS5_9PEZI|nr:hypothetical protein C8A01DRAFT_33840 [Parachaetomium inaequale]